MFARLGLSGKEEHISSATRAGRAFPEPTGEAGMAPERQGSSDWGMSKVACQKSVSF